jgi:hypothetical protein
MISYAKLDHSEVEVLFSPNHGGFILFMATPRAKVPLRTSWQGIMVYHRLLRP